MTPHTSTDIFYNVLDHLKTRGIRITKTRKAVLNYLIDSSEHPSAERIYTALRTQFPSMSLATVYNNLKVLVDCGFVSEIRRNNDTTTYYDFMGHNHLNLICETCGKITDVQLKLPSVKEKIEQLSSYRITREITTAYGICPDCLTKNKS